MPKKLEELGTEELINSVHQKNCQYHFSLRIQRVHNFSFQSTFQIQKGLEGGIQGMDN